MLRTTRPNNLTCVVRQPTPSRQGRSKHAASSLLELWTKYHGNNVSAAVMCINYTLVAPFFRGCRFRSPLAISVSFEVEVALPYILDGRVLCPNKIHSCDATSRRERDLTSLQQSPLVRFHNPGNVSGVQ